MMLLADRLVDYMERRCGVGAANEGEWVNTWSFRTRAVHRMATNYSKYSETDIYTEISLWIIGFTQEEKTKACQFMYDTIPNQTLEDCGRDIISDFCTNNGISITR